MSISQYSNNVSRLQTQVADLRLKQNNERKTLNEVRATIIGLQKQMTTSKNLSSIQSYQRQALQKEKVFQQSEKKIADLGKQIAQKEKDLLKQREFLSKANDAEENKRRAAEQKNQRDRQRSNQNELAHLRSVNAELERQRELFSEFAFSADTNIEDNNNSYSKSELSDLNQRIDQVLEQLNKLGLGQEIIFDEIDRLKTISDKIGKKDLSLLLLGQLVSYGSSILEPDTAKNIFEFLTVKTTELLS